MPKIDVYNIEGKKVSDIELNENVFGIKPNEKIVHIALVNYMANQRQGTANTKTRAEVAGVTVEDLYDIVTMTDLADFNECFVRS